MGGYTAILVLKTIEILIPSYETSNRERIFILAFYFDKN
jgi:hypothetical protein